MIEKVKKILDKGLQRCQEYAHKDWDASEVAVLILSVKATLNQLVEPKPDEIEATYTLNCDKCGEIFYSPNGFPSPQLCPECQKPDESRLLTPEELFEVDYGYPPSPKDIKNVLENVLSPKLMEVTEAQLAKDKEWEAKTASIKDTEVGRLVDEANARGFRDCALLTQAECQTRVEKIKRELEKPCLHKTNPLEFKSKQFCELCWQEFWKQEGIK